MNTNSNIQIERTPVKLDKFRDSFKKNAKTAQLRQTVTKHYPSVKSGNELSTGLFSSEAFGKGESYSHERVAFADVPEAFTEEHVNEQLNSHPGACIYKIFSYNVEDLLSIDQKNAMRDNLSEMTIADYQERLAVRDKEDNIIKEDGNVLYSVSIFNLEAKEDVDMRATSKPNAERVTFGKESNADAKVEITADAEKQEA